MPRTISTGRGAVVAASPIPIQVLGHMNADTDVPARDIIEKTGGQRGKDTGIEDRVPEHKAPADALDASAGGDKGLLYLEEARCRTRRKQRHEGVEGVARYDLHPGIVRVGTEIDCRTRSVSDQVGGVEAGVRRADDRSRVGVGIADGVQCVPVRKGRRIDAQRQSIAFARRAHLDTNRDIAWCVRDEANARAH